MAILKASKSANQSYVFLSNNTESLTYTIIIENISNNLASNVVVTDIIPYGACFQVGTFTLNGTTLVNEDPNLGVNIGNINPNSSVVVTFDVIVDSNNPPMELQNYATITYTDCSNLSENETIVTNVVVTPVISVCVEVLKSASQCAVQLNDIINYRLIIKNNSTVNLENVILYDKIPNELTVVPDSIFINGVKESFANFEKGINLGTINPYKIIIVLFQAVVDCLPCGTEIQNQACLNFDYSFNIDGLTYTSSGNAKSNMVKTKAGPESFKQIILDSELNLPYKTEFPIEIIDKFIDVEINRTEIIETIRGASCEGQILTGNKLLIDGTLHERIEYTELCSNQSVNVSEYNVPFNTFVVLPSCCTNTENITVESNVENFDIRVTNCSSLYQNVALLLKVIF